MPAYRVQCQPGLSNVRIDWINLTWVFQSMELIFLAERKSKFLQELSKSVRQALLQLFRRSDQSIVDFNALDCGLRCIGMSCHVLPVVILSNTIPIVSNTIERIETFFGDNTLYLCYYYRDEQINWRLIYGFLQNTVIFVSNWFDAWLMHRRYRSWAMLTDW